MENKDSSRQDRLFHFTLDLPDRPSPHTSDKRDENIFQNTVRSKKRRPDSQPQERQDTINRNVRKPLNPKLKHGKLLNPKCGQDKRLSPKPGQDKPPLTRFAVL